MPLVQEPPELRLEGRVQPCAGGATTSWRSVELDAFVPKGASVRIERLSTDGWIPVVRDDGSDILAAPGSIAGWTLGDLRGPEPLDLRVVLRPGADGTLPEIDLAWVDRVCDDGLSADPDPYDFQEEGVQDWEEDWDDC